MPDTFTSNLVTLIARPVLSRLSLACLTCCLTCGLASAVVLAEDGASEGKQEVEPSKRLSYRDTLTVDPLGAPLAEVDKPIALEHQQRQLLFASEDNLAAFKTAPDKYQPKLKKRIIEQQRKTYPLTTCIVSGEDLDSMGEPIELVHGNRLVRLCCNMCRADFADDPEKYLAKINEAVIQQQAPTYPTHMCIITNQELDIMGGPFEEVVGTRLIRTCCVMCNNMLHANPARYLVMLDELDRSTKDSGGDQE